MRNADRPTLILMLKAPVPGRVKTRLGRDVGMTVAAEWFRHQTGRLIRDLRDPRWRMVLAVAPDGAVASRWWPTGIDRIAQGNGNLGDRMHRALHRAMPGPALLIGGDIPRVARRDIAGAFRALRHHDAVLGPAPDGGFWAVGLSGPQMPRRLFRHTRWSTEHALADTLASLAGQRIALTATRSDVDTIDDLAPGAIHATPLRITPSTGAAP